MPKELDSAMLPKMNVFETGEISFSVSHPDFVPDRPFRTVTTKPPAGAPLPVWASYLWSRVQGKQLTARPEAVVLKLGAILRMSVRSESNVSQKTPLFAQLSAMSMRETNFWERPEPGVLLTRRLAPGSQTVRAVQFDGSGAAWFSEVIALTAVAGQTNQLDLRLQPGVAVRGQLDDTVPRPVNNGRVVAEVWPSDHKPSQSPPRWHTWTLVREDGSFEIGSLPPGDLEIVALCDGFVSTNGPGKYTARYPQQHLLGSNDLTVVIGMERTARLEVQLRDDQGNPVPNAEVSTWPNVRYGDWGSTILMSDCYNTADRLLAGPRTDPQRWFQSVPDFNGKSDQTGLAVLSNLPATVSQFAVEHPNFALPATVSGGGQKRREASVALSPGETHRVMIHLEPRERSPISHY